MGRVDCFRLGDLDLWFNSHDHLPPHFHARRRGEFDVRVYFLLCAEGNLVYDVKWGRGPRAAELAALCAATIAHRPQLLDEWEAKVCQWEGGR